MLVRSLLVFRSTHPFLGYWTAKLVPRVFSFSAAILDRKTALSSFRLQTSLFLCAKDGGTVKVGEKSLHLSFCPIFTISYSCFFPVIRLVSRDPRSACGWGLFVWQAKESEEESRKCANVRITHNTLCSSNPSPSPPASPKCINCNTVILRRNWKKILIQNFWVIECSLLPRVYCLAKSLHHNKHFLRGWHNQKLESRGQSPDHLFVFVPCSYSTRSDDHCCRQPFLVSSYQLPLSCQTGQTIIWNTTHIRIIDKQAQFSHLSTTTTTIFICTHSCSKIYY